MLPQPWIVLAEIINFLVLVALLQRFLYKPIMRAMAQREASIADRLQSADNREAEAQETVEQYQQLQRDWSTQTQARQHQLHEQIEVERTDRLNQIRTELETQRAQWYEALHQEQTVCLNSLRDYARSQLIQTIRVALQALANTTLEQQMVETFLGQLPELEPSERESLQAAVARQQDPPHWTIGTTFPLEEALQSRLIGAVRTHLLPQSLPDAFTFEIHPEYLCGIELRTQGYKLDWHIEHYLDSLESQFSKALEQVSVY
ncbi:MAG: hypothetical protein AAGF01_19445 [Cyanobacteria bacterium P01_G01_bin.38]